MVEKSEVKKSFYELLITEIPIIVLFSVFILLRSLYVKLTLIEIILIILILLPSLTLARFLTIFFLSNRGTEDLTHINYLAFSGIPSYLTSFFITLILAQLILGKITLLEITILTISFLSATTVTSIISLGILIYEYFDPKKSEKRVNIVSFPVITTISSFISSVILTLSVLLIKTYLNISFSVLELIALNVLVAIAVFITLKKIYSTVEKDIAKIKNLLLESNNNNLLEESFELFSEQFKEIQKVIQQLKADYKLKKSLTTNILKNMKEALQKLEKNFSTILEIINKLQKNKNLGTSSIKYNLRRISRDLVNTLEDLESTKIELLKLEEENKDTNINEIIEYFSNELETKTKISEILNSVLENLKKANDKLSTINRDIPNFINSSDKIYTFVEEARNIGFKLNNLSVTMDIELSKTKHEKQKLSVISQEIRKISEKILKIISLTKTTEVEKHKAKIDISLLLDSFSSLDTKVKDLLKETNESLETSKKLLANLKTTHDSFTKLYSTIKTTEEETISITHSLLKINSILYKEEKEISSFDDSVKKTLDNLSILKEELEEKIREINTKIKELET